MEVECFVPATKQYPSQKPNNDCFALPFLQLLTCLAIPQSQHQRKCGEHGSRLWGGRSMELRQQHPSVSHQGPHPPSLATSPFSPFVFLFPFSPSLSLSPSFPLSSCLTVFSLLSLLPLPFPLRCHSAVPLLSPLLHSLPGCAVLLMCSNGMAGKSFALPFSLFFSCSIIKTAPSLAVMGASVFSPSPVSLT